MVAEAWEAVEVAGVVEASEVSVAAAAAPAWAAAARALGPPVAEAGLDILHMPQRLNFSGFGYRRRELNTRIMMETRNN